MGVRVPPLVPGSCRMARARGLGCVPGRVGSSPTSGSNNGVGAGRRHPLQGRRAGFESRILHQQGRTRPKGQSREGAGIPAIRWRGWKLPAKFWRVGRVGLLQRSRKPPWVGRLTVRSSRTPAATTWRANWPARRGRLEGASHLQGCGDGALRSPPHQGERTGRRAGADC